MFSFFASLLSAKAAIKVAIVAGAALVGIASYTVLKKPHDNPIEECAEYIIAKEIGFDFDLSFTSAE